MNENKVRGLVGWLIFVGMLWTIAIFYLAITTETESVDFDDLTLSLVDSGLGFKESESNKALLDKRVIVVTTDVNALLANKLISDLLLMDKVNPGATIDLYLRTDGGWGADAFAVIDVMSTMQSPVNVHAIGETHSAGLMLLAAATGKRYAYSNAVLGFHTLDDDEDTLYEERYLDLWKRTAKLPEKWLKRRDDEMLYFSPEDGLKYGVIDEVVKPQK